MFRLNEPKSLHLNTLEENTKSSHFDARFALAPNGQIDRIHEPLAGAADTEISIQGPGKPSRRVGTAAVLVVALCATSLTFYEIARRSLSQSAVPQQSADSQSVERPVQKANMLPTVIANQAALEDEDHQGNTTASSDPASVPTPTAHSYDGSGTYNHRSTSGGRNHRAEYQAYLNAEADLHRSYAQRAYAQDAAMRAQASQMQEDIMRRQLYDYRTRLNNVVPGLQPIPGHYMQSYP